MPAYKTVNLLGVVTGTVTVPVAEIPAMEAAIHAGSWWSPSMNPTDHWDMSKVVRYIITG